MGDGMTRRCRTLMEYIEHDAVLFSEMQPYIHRAVKILDTHQHALPDELLAPYDPSGRCFWFLHEARIDSHNIRTQCRIHEDRVVIDAESDTGHSYALEIALDSPGSVTKNPNIILHPGRDRLQSLDMAVLFGMQDFSAYMEDLQKWCRKALPPVKQHNKVSYHGYYAAVEDALTDYLVIAGKVDDASEVLCSIPVTRKTSDRLVMSIETTGKIHRRIQYDLMEKYNNLGWIEEDMTMSLHQSCRWICALLLHWDFNDALLSTCASWAAYTWGIPDKKRLRDILAKEPCEEDPEKE